MTTLIAFLPLIGILLLVTASVSTVALIAIWRELNLLRTNRERLTPTLQQLFGRPPVKPRQHRSRV